MLFLRLLLLMLVVIVSDAADMNGNFDKAKAQEMYNCFFAILCKARKPREFRRVMLKAHPELIQLGFQWLWDISRIKANDSDAFWDHYDDYKCPLPEEKKHAYFIEWMKRLGEYWANACVNESSEKCIKMGDAEKEYMLVNAEYTANGVCTAQAQELGEENYEEGKEKFEEGKKTFEQGMKKMPMPMG